MYGTPPPCDGKDSDAEGQRSFGCRMALEEQPPELPPAVCSRGQPSPEEGRRGDGRSCTEPGSSLPPGGSWRDMEDHAAPAVGAMCGRSTLAVCSGFRNSRLLIPLVELICASFWPPPFSVPTTCPSARGLCCHCWLLVPLASAYCICFDLLGLAFSHSFSFLLYVSKRQLRVVIVGSFHSSPCTSCILIALLSPLTCSLPVSLHDICGLQTL